jgi:DNA-binding transcriptional LysR family regulator
MPVELRLLRCALALAEHQNFVRAAQASQMSQPSLSRNIQQIELRVGTRLFERAAGGVVPTDAGIIFLEQAREVVARSQDLSREMDLLRGLDKGELGIGAGTYPSAMIVEQGVAQLVRAHPGVRLHIKIDNRENLLPLLEKRELDIVVIVADGKDEERDLHITRMNRHQAYFVVRGGHPLATSKRAPALQGILEFPVVMTSRLTGAMLKRFLSGAFGDKPVPPMAKSFPTIACESIAMMKTIIASTDAVALLPLNQVMAEVRSRQLFVLPIVVPWLQADLAVVRMAHRSLSLLGEAFVRTLQEEDAKLLEFERRAAAKLFAAPRRTHSRAKSATSAPTDERRDSN